MAGLGGVVVIDEAYALNERHTFANDVIAEMLPIMENYRGDMAIVFCGYEDKMNEFFNLNAGIESRIGHIIKFEDYTKDELNAKLEADFNESKVIISKEPSKFKNWKNKIDVYSLNDAKGLEFQSTYVDVTNMTDNEKYIAFTRALNKLTIIE